MPGESTINIPSFLYQLTDLVMPGIFPTWALDFPIKELSSKDFPTLGIPTAASLTSL